MKTILVSFFFLFLACTQNTPEPKNQPAKTANFVIHRGLNVSHWLSQTNIRGAERAAYVTEKDFQIIADMGFDHVRIPIDEVQFWTEKGAKEKAAFKLLHNGIQWSLKNNLRVIVDLHTLRSHHFNRADSRQLWEDKSAQKQFIGFWKQLSAELKDYSVDSVAYEMMNEAVSDDPEDWNKLINWAIDELRKLEPARVIVMGSNNWQQVHTFKDLRVPENDKNIIPSFHFYTPFCLTHYKAPWSSIHIYEGPVNYPGWSVDTTRYDQMDPEVLSEVKKHNGYYDREVLEKAIMQAVVVAEKHDLPLYCGEFGCYPTTPMDMRQKWYRDMIDIFDKHDIAYSHWNYKNDFPVVNEDLSPIPEIVNILVPGKSQ